MAWYKVGGGGVKSDEVTATLSNVLAGKTALTQDSNDDVGTGTLPLASVLSNNGGTMPNRGAVSASVSVDGTYTIQAGYHNGSGTVAGPTLVGDASSNQVLHGATYYSNSGTLETGTMQNNGKVTPSGLNCGASYTIPEGYHNGEGKVTANSLASQTGVDSGKTAVIAGKMLTGYQGWVNGSKVSGTMANRGKVTPSGLVCGSSYTIPDGYHDGTGVVTANSLASQTGVDNGKSAVTAATMLTSYQGWVNGNKISGTMPNRGAATSSLNCGAQYTIPAGYHNGSGVVTANSLASQTGVDTGKTAVTATTMLTGYQGWVNGSKISGTMPNRAAVAPSGLNCGGSYTIPEGYHNGSGVVTANSLSSQTGVDSGKTAVVAGAMLSGYQGWVNGNKVSGSIPTYDGSIS